MKLIQINLNEFMLNPSTSLASSGFKVADFNALNKVLNNTTEDFLIFDNAGGRKFDIIFDRLLLNEDGKNELYEVKDTINIFLKEHKNWIYSYQINGKQTLLKRI